MTPTSALPPYADWLGITRGTDATGASVFTMPFGPRVLGRPGFLHGGAIAGLLEIAAIGTLMAALDGEEPPPRVKPVTVTVDYMRGGREGPTCAQARIARLGNRIANVDVRAWQDDADRLIAAARMTLMLDR